MTTPYAIVAIIVLAAVSGCQTTDKQSITAGAIQPSATFATLERITLGEIRVNRSKQCIDAWRDYENRCHRELRLWNGMSQDQFCGRYARSSASIQALPGIEKRTRRCI